MEKFWEIAISVNDEEYWSLLRVKATKVEYKGFDEETEMYVVQIDEQLLYFDEHIVYCAEIKKF